MTESSDLHINSAISIARRELRFSFVRSSGPGGQNVNKVASKAVLRWSINSSPSIPDQVRTRLQSLFGRRISDHGELVLTSQRYRDQARNIEDCLEKLRVMVLTAATIPKKRKRTRVPKAAKEARLRQKRATSDRKVGRRRVSDNE